MVQDLPNVSSCQLTSNTLVRGDLNNRIIQFLDDLSERVYAIQLPVSKSNGLELFSHHLLFTIGFWDRLLEGIELLRFLFYSQHPKSRPSGFRMVIFRTQFVVSGF
jgi:hypothetical protein